MYIKTRTSGPGFAVAPSAWPLSSFIRTTPQHIQQRRRKQDTVALLSSPSELHLLASPVMDSSKLLSSIHLSPLLPVLITVFLASLLAQWVMPKLSVFPYHTVLPAGAVDPSLCRSGTDTLKRTSKTSSFVFRRYVNQPRKEEPFCALDNSFNQDHEGLTALGSWTNGENPEPPYGLEAPDLAPYSRSYTSPSGGDY